jgi:hypothetical protein
MEYSMSIRRFFLGLRGNEIQNNLWDYHPHQEDETEEQLDNYDEYIQLEPNDKYKGGYWFPDDPKGRYLHIIALKSTSPDNNSVRFIHLIVKPVFHSRISPPLAKNFVT